MVVVCLFRFPLPAAEKRRGIPSVGNRSGNGGGSRVQNLVLGNRFGLDVANRFANGQDSMCCWGGRELWWGRSRATMAMMSQTVFLQLAADG